jgi:hypothetical protein
VSEEKEYRVVRCEGKAYFGEVLQEDEGITLGGAVELFSAMLPTPGGIQKQVIIIGLDYNGGPLKHLFIKSPGPMYRNHDMDARDWAKLKEDYNTFRTS